MDKPDGDGSVGQASMDALTWVTRVHVRDVACQSGCCREVPSSNDLSQAVPAQETGPVQLRSKISNMQQSAHHACPGGIFAEVEIPPPLDSPAELPELVFADALSSEGERRDESKAVDDEPRPEKGERATAQGLLGTTEEKLSQVEVASSISKNWKGRLPSRRWWLDTTWNVACVGAMLALALTVRQWLFLGADESNEETNIAGSVTAVPDHEEPFVAPVVLEKVAGPVGRITDQLPIGESPSELDVMTGPLTDMGIEQVNFVEHE